MSTPTAAEQERIAADYERSTARDRGARDGVVTTPVEIVDFITRAVNDILMERWGVTAVAARVMLEDPFAGTGIFGARMLTTCPVEDVTTIAGKLRCFEIDPDALLALAAAAADAALTILRKEHHRD